MEEYEIILKNNKVIPLTVERFEIIRKVLGDELPKFIEVTPKVIIAVSSIVYVGERS